MSVVSTKVAFFAIAGLALLVGAADHPAMAATSKKLAVTVEGIKNGARIPAEYAYCVPTDQGHTTDGANKNPSIKWSKGPAATQSYAIIVVDTDVPTVFDDANKEGKTIPASMKRRDFYHFILVDIPASKTELAMGADSDGITKGGKPAGATPNGVRGINDYSATNGGYDGPCPPWNDQRLHHYHFIVYALDTASLGLSGKFGGPAAKAAMARHILAKGEVVGTYTQNPALGKKKAKAS
jgi:Raf kinase inhibitor-like YbhB/YbcL family protein